MIEQGNEKGKTNNIHRLLHGGQEKLEPESINARAEKQESRNEKENLPQP